MTERIIKAGTYYYAGGTIPKTAGHDGVKDIPMVAAEYMPEEIEIKPKKIYRGGTTTSTLTVEQNDDSDDMGRELFK